MVVHCGSATSYVNRPLGGGFSSNLGEFDSWVRVQVSCSVRAYDFKLINKIKY